ncbi:MAG: DUF86 domain-containing protein [bacterium]|nr:DUF86 domain-containing protein [bacterium]
MTRKRAIADYLRDILDAAEKADRFTEGMNLASFSADEKTVYAVIRALELVGEAAKKVPASVRKRHPDVPWQAAAGLRDKLIHDYFGVNLEVVWQTIREDLPGFKAAIVNVLAEVSNKKADG